MWSACRKTVLMVAPARFAPLAICAAKRALFPRFRGLPRTTSTVGFLGRGIYYLRFVFGPSSLGRNYCAPQRFASSCPLIRGHKAAGLFQTHITEWTVVASEL
jgi:hypothetical protein